MFFYETFTWIHLLTFIVITGVLILLNEFTRRNKYVALFFFVAVPIALTFLVWPKTCGLNTGTTTATWFNWVKAYSALAGCLGFMVLRYSKKLQNNKWMLAFPAFILAFNILEAVIRDFQVAALHDTGNPIIMYGGIWNIMNGIAGILNILAISGWLGIVITKDKSKDMIWTDQLWFWIIAYDIWNLSYVYNCISDHSFYAGFILLTSCTLPAFFIKRGAWLQHRAHTLALWIMFAMCFPVFTDSLTFGLKATRSETPYILLSVLSLVVNMAVFGFHIYKIVKFKRNPFKEDVYSDLNCYKQLQEEYKK